MLVISQLLIYPIKSLRGISVSRAFVTDRGFQHDHRWMLVDENNKFLTLREFPKMTLLQPVLKKESLRIQSLERQIEDLIIPLNVVGDTKEKVTIWNATCEAIRVGKKADQWFTEILGARCKLVFMPETSIRPVDTTSGFAPKGKRTSFADAYPFMMLSDASMDDLNSRLSSPVSTKRFRPNIVFSGGYPYQEDKIKDFTINQIRFTGLENCARCQIPNVDPETGLVSRDKEPLKTLASYRKHDRNINFGRNVVHTGTGILAVGDEIHLM